MGRALKCVLLVYAFACACAILAGASASPPPLQSNPDSSLHALLTHPGVDPLTGASLTPAGPRTPLDRLPRHIHPLHYVITHRPLLDAPEGDDPARYTAPGSVTITIATLLPGYNNVTLHINSELVTIDEDGVSMTTADTGANLGPLHHVYEPEKEFYTIVLATEGLTLTPGQNYKVEIPFTTRTSGEPFGYWVADSPDPAQPGVDVRISATILEPHFARRLLPCFDEPDLKATIEVVIGRKDTHQSLAHTPKRETTTEGDIFWDHYEPTPLMSIYLLCLVVAPNHYAAAYDDQGGFPAAPVGAWAPQHLIARGGGLRAARITARSLTYFRDTYETDYALSKLDSIVIPGFPAGALENWGINTYVDTRLLHYEGETTELERGRSISTQHHEVSHQWFGNLVTCKWWDDIWLNEGLANYQSFKGVLATSPEFDPVTLFVSDSVQVAMRADQNPALTHPVHFETLPDNWMSIFDTLSYSKGGSLIRMLEGVLGAGLLDEGLKDFLTTHAFKGADQDDLFASIDQVVAARARAGAEESKLLPEGATIKSIMDGWTLQSGYPLVRLSRASAGRIFISQERFTLNRDPVSFTPTFWDIPLKVVHKGAVTPEGELWLTSTTSMTSYTTEGLNTSSQWVMANPDAFGYYRVHYDAHLFAMILGQLETNPQDISPGSRSQLLDDYWNMELGGYVPVTTALQLTRYLGNEDHLVVWTTVLHHLRAYYTRLSGTFGFIALQRYMLPRVEAVLGRVGWSQRPLPDLGNEVILRANLLDWACGLGAERCHTEAERLFLAYRDDPTEIYDIIPVDIQATILCAAVGSPTLGATAHPFLLEQYNLDTTPVEVRLRQLAALACASDPDLLLATLVAASDSSQIAPAHRLPLFQRVAENPAGRDAAFMVASQLTVSHQMTLADFERIVGTLAGFWHTEEQLGGLASFIGANEELLDEIRPALNGHLDTIWGNGLWMENKGKVVVQWMLGENRKSLIN